MENGISKFHFDELPSQTMHTTRRLILVCILSLGVGGLGGFAAFVFLHQNHCASIVQRKLDLHHQNLLLSWKHKTEQNHEGFEQSRVPEQPRTSDDKPHQNITLTGKEKTEQNLDGSEQSHLLQELQTNYDQCLNDVSELLHDHREWQKNMDSLSLQIRNLKQELGHMAIHNANQLQAKERQLQHCQTNLQAYYNLQTARASSLF